MADEQVVRKGTGPDQIYTLLVAWWRGLDDFGRMAVFLLAMGIMVRLMGGFGD